MLKTVDLRSLTGISVHSLNEGRNVYGSNEWFVQ